MITAEFRAEVERFARHMHTIILKKTAFGGGRDRTCVPWALAGSIALSRHGVRTIHYQGGSAFWPVVKPEYDDGVTPNRFGYQWSLAEAMPHLLDGDLPEVHAWLAFDDPDGDRWVLDLAAGGFAREGARELKLKPEAVAAVPEAFWHPVSEPLPAEVEYRADANASRTVAAFVSALRGEISLQSFLTK